MQEGLSEKLFIDRICKESKAGEKFCFILGAGASWSSEIPTGRGRNVCGIIKAAR